MSIFAKTTCLISAASGRAYPPSAMALFSTSLRLPQCSSCVRRITHQNLDVWGAQQTRNISKRAKEAERNIVVKLLKDVPRYGRAGSYVQLNPSLMRNKWFPARVADYVPAVQLKQLKARDLDLSRDVTFGVRVVLEEVEEVEEVIAHTRRVRPIEIDVLSPERSAELIETFVPSTIDFYRQRIEQDSQTTRQYITASGAADVLTAAAMASRPKASANAIYGSVSTADIVQTIKSALAHNDDAARVILNEADVVFMSGHEGEDTSRVKQLGNFQVGIRVPGAAKPLVRSIRVKEKASEA